MPPICDKQQLNKHIPTIKYSATHSRDGNYYALSGTHTYSQHSKTDCISVSPKFCSWKRMPRPPASGNVLHRSLQELDGKWNQSNPAYRQTASPVARPGARLASARACPRPDRPEPPARKESAPPDADPVSRPAAHVGSAATHTLPSSSVTHAR